MPSPGSYLQGKGTVDKTFHIRQSFYTLGKDADNIQEVIPSIVNENPHICLDDAR